MRYILTDLRCWSHQFVREIVFALTQNQKKKEKSDKRFAYDQRGRNR